MYQLSFVEMYRVAKGKPTPCEAFIKEVCELTHRSRSTVRKWVVGISEPDSNIKHQLSKHYKTPVNVLFPNSDNSSDEKQ